MIRSYYRCCCINEPVIFSHCVHPKLGHRFYALLEVCSDCDDIVPINLIKVPFNPLSDSQYLQSFLMHLFPHEVFFKKEFFVIHLQWF